jgi:hypothetical protein
MWEFLALKGKEVHLIEPVFYGYIDELMVIANQGEDVSGNAVFRCFISC